MCAIVDGWVYIQYTLTDARIIPGNIHRSWSQQLPLGSRAAFHGLLFFAYF